MGFLTKLQHAWSAFNEKSSNVSWEVNTSYSRPDRTKLPLNIDRTIVNSIYNRIAVDVSAIPIMHARMDENGRFSEVIDSELNKRLTRNANKDQSARDFIRDAVFSICSDGVVALIPTHTDTDPDKTKTYTINSLRTGKIEEWYPDAIKVNVYNEDSGKRESVIVSKDAAAIIENPFYEIMNCPNSSLQRLISKLNLLDKLDNDSGSGKLDLIIQLPYTVRSELKKKQAEERRKDIEMQLVGSKYGIAYIDATEHVTQLNRPAENNLVAQIKDLTATVYGQIGLSETIMNGTASEQEMINYHNSTIEPFVTAIANAIEWKFISKTAKTQGQAIYFYRDPFRLIPAEKIAEIADKFTRNEVLSPNEIRAIIGYRPSKDPKSDELRNRNLNQESNALKNQNEVSSDSQDAEQSAIEHHGIEGQKWGVRRGPPYPLGSGKISGNSNNSYEGKYKNRHAESAKQIALQFVKTLVAYTVPGAGVAMNAVTLHKYAKSNLDTRDYTKKDGNVEKISEMKRKDSNSISEDDLKLINPGNGNGRVNNCGNCTVTYEMRSRGYDVVARRRASGVTISTFDSWFPGHEREHVDFNPNPHEKTDDFVDRSVKQLTSSIKSYGNNSRGYLAIRWGAPDGSIDGGGHVINWRVNNGKVEFIDAQSGKNFPIKDFGLCVQSYDYGRLDNVTPSDSVGNACVSRGRKDDD